MPKDSQKHLDSYRTEIRNVKNRMKEERDAREKRLKEGQNIKLAPTVEQENVEDQYRKILKDAYTDKRGK